MSCLPLRIGPDRGPSMGLVVKVKYEGTLRRFKIYIREDGRPDTSLNALRYKICNLFKFNLNSDIIITYIDEDNDVINMVDEDDLLDAMRQRLNPLRLEVSFTGQKGVGTAMRSCNGTSTLKTYANPKGNNQTSNSESICLDKALKDLPKLLILTQIKSTEDPFPKYVTPTLKMAEINDSSTKHVANAGSLGEGCQGLGPCSDTQANNGTNHTLNEQENGPSASPVYTDISSNGLKRTTRPSKNTLRIFHKEVQCDGCGMSPIVGPRWASKIEDNHDLCLACFCKMGNRDDYTIIVHGNALPNFPKCHGCGMSPVVYPFDSSKIKDDYDLCFDCFCKMGNEDEYRTVDREEVEDRLRIDHSRASYRPQCIYREGLAYQETLFDTLWQSPSYSCSQRSSISSFLSSVGKMDNQSPGKLNCCFVKDVTVCDGTQLAPGTHFTKIWRLHNTGTLPWPHHTQLVRIGGIDFGAGNEVELEIQENGCPVDEDFDAVIQCIAPMQPGQYISYWRLMTPSGQMFGQQVWVVIQVVKSSKEAFLPLPLKSFQTTKHPDGNAGSFEGKSKQRLFGVDISFNEGILHHPMKSVLTTKDTDGNAVPFQGQSKPKLFGVDISFNEGILPHPMKSVLTTKDTDGNAVPFQGQSKQKLFGVDISFNEGILPHPMKSVLTTKDTDGSAVPFQGQSKPKLFGVDISLNDFNEKAILSDDNLNLELSDRIKIPDSASMIEQPGEKASVVTLQDFDVPVAIPCGASMIEQPGEKVSGITWQEFDFPIELQRLSIDTTFMPSDVFVRAPSLAMSDTNSYSGKYPADIKQMEQRKVNADVLRKNSYDLQKPLDAQWNAAEWDPILLELQEMGFYEIL